MPCYLFSWHGYGAWATERPPVAAVGRQLLLPDQVVRDRYREPAADPAACFDDAAQRALIDQLQAAAAADGLRLHAVAAEPTGVHAVVSWGDPRPEGQVRRGLHDALAARLNTGGERVWLSHRGRRRRIEDRTHFQHVTERILPRHPGWRWDERRGLQR
ncbi:MAG: hypothetical protein KDA44_11255 [Planctomycetales bacterium]|nr:hypothetical protein [Planctomycetales bacterium]